MASAKLIVKNISRIDNKTILNVDTISDGIVKLYTVYNLSNKFNVRLNSFYNDNNDNNIFTHPINDLQIEIQLIENYKKIEINDILTPITYT